MVHLGVVEEGKEEKSWLQPKGKGKNGRKNGDGGVLRAGEISWWSVICALMKGRTAMRVLMIESIKEIVESITLSLQLRWPEAELLTVAEGTRGIELVEGEAPDVVILDLDLPSMDAFEVLSQIRLFSDVPIIVLSKGDDEMRRVRALEMGADECITKPFSPMEFLASVKALLRRAGMSELREGRLPSFISEGLTINFTTREVFICGEVVKLTPTEYELLTYLVRNEGRVIPHRALVEKVWGSEYIGDPYLLKKYISRIRHKLGDNAANPQIVIAERGVGYKFIRPPD